jgi:hypothetical protein
VKEIEKWARRMWGLLPSVVLTASIASCGDSGGSDPAAACQGAASHARSCGLVTDGEVRCSSNPSSVLSCESSCEASATCQEVEALLCSGSVTGSLLTCVQRCTEFRCGNGASIALRQQCDGNNDCADGSDERGCPTCTNGTVIRQSAICNGLPQCPDGSDEQNCPTFTCQSGATVPADARCNGIPQCGDRSDEAGCPTFQCANGSTVPASDRCNGVPRCSDGSDERGCPAPAQRICNGQTIPGPIVGLGPIP